MLPDKSHWAFPTGVGMNRKTLASRSTLSSVPHGRGDEPKPVAICVQPFFAFPTGVGMNRFRVLSQPPRNSVPHGRGDEPPSWGRIGSGVTRVPHGRGDEPVSPTASIHGEIAFPTGVGMNRD